MQNSLTVRLTYMTLRYDFLHFANSSLINGIIKHCVDTVTSTLKERALTPEMEHLTFGLDITGGNGYFSGSRHVKKKCWDKIYERK